MAGGWQKRISMICALRKVERFMMTQPQQDTVEIAS